MGKKEKKKSWVAYRYHYGNWLKANFGKTATMMMVFEPRGGTSPIRKLQPLE